MIEHIHELTLNYIDAIPKTERKKIGQFFTQPSIAEFMANLTEWNNESIRILDPGAGSAILASSICQKCLHNNAVKNIHVDFYENNVDVIPILKQSVEYIKGVMQQNGKNFTYNIIEDNFILSNADLWNNKVDKTEKELYDVIISNPPYKKIRKNDAESVAMDNIVYGQPNIYFLFMAMSAKLLKEEGQMVYIVPRSFTSGAYFKKFREYFLNTVNITHIHLFESRSDVFKTDSVLQETLILKAIKTDINIDTINISKCSASTFIDIEEIRVNKNIIIDRKTDNQYILIPTDIEEIEIIDLINSWNNTLPQLGFKLSTGKVVDFRATEFIKNVKEENTVPLFWSCNFSNNRIAHPIDDIKSPQYIIDYCKNLLMDNRDYIFVKRFTSKEEHKRIQCSLYFSKNYDYKYIGVENHLNYITKLNEDFTKEELYGLFAILNSTYIDKYYRILNGSTQVNASEMNSIPIPNLNFIKKIGKEIMINFDISVENCDNIIRALFIDNVLKDAI